MIDAPKLANACPPELIAERDSAIVVTPDELPAFIMDAVRREQEPHSVTCDELNFLVGDAEPQEVVELRTRRVHAVGFAACAGLALLLIGMERLTAAHQRMAREAMTHHNTIAQAVNGSALVINDDVTRADADSLRDELTRERDALLLTRAPRAVPPQPRDATQSLALLLAVWPTIAPTDGCGPRLRPPAALFAQCDDREHALVLEVRREDHVHNVGFTLVDRQSLARERWGEQASSRIPISVCR